MELFRKLDGLAEEIQSLQPPVDLWRKFVYCTSLSCSVLASVDHMQSQGFDKIPSPVSVAHFSQHKLVKLLLTRLKILGYCISSPDEAEFHTWDRKILMGYECVSLDITNEGVKVGAALHRNGEIEERELHCNILIGSDGARSTVRNLIGIDMKGQRDLQKLVSVHFRSRDLGQYLLQERPGMLFFIFNPEAIGVLVAHDLSEGEFVLQVPYYPPQQRFEDFSFEVCEEIIFKLAGWKPADLRVVDVKPWVMHAEVAENYVSSNNRVILVGDSAHRFPPAGGFGMNTGIQDAHNLAWKISSMFRGIASPSIIQTYEMERRPIAVSNTELSVRNFKAAMSIPAALGLDPTVANSVHQVINNSLGSFLAPNFQKAVLEGIFSVGRAQLSNFILNENNPIGSSRLANLRRIIDEGKSLQLQFPAEDLGFCYQQGALITDTDDTALNERISSPQNDKLEGCFTAKPGSRLPHMQVGAFKSSNSKDAISTLDFIPGDKLEFVLIIAPKLSSYDLARAALRAADEFKVPLKVCIIWPQGSADADLIGSKTELQPWKNYIDVEEVHSSSPYSWWDICNMTTCGAILVRPDEHIAWRTNSDLVKDRSSELERIFSQVLRVAKDPR